MICHSLGISRKGLLTSWVASTYYGKGMRQYVEEYYRACGVCQDSRVLHGKIQGELQPLEAPTEQLLTHLSGRSLVFMGSKHG